MISRIYHAILERCLDETKGIDEYLECVLEARDMGLIRAVEDLNIPAHGLKELSDREIRELNEQFVARIDNALGLLESILDECEEYCEERECLDVRGSFYFTCMDDCMRNCVKRRLW